MATRNRTNPAAFWVLLAVQAAGAAIIIYNGVPIYRRLLARVPERAADDRVVALAVVASLLGLCAHWVRRRTCPLPEFRRRELPGHLILFCSRLAFVFATALFSTIFFARFGELDASVLRVLVLLVVLYSMFCFTTEVEGLGRAMQDGEC